MSYCHYHLHRYRYSYEFSNRIREDGDLSVLLGKMT